MVLLLQLLIVCFEPFAEVFLVCILFRERRLFECLGSLSSFFALEGHEAGDGGSELIELFVLEVVDLFVDISHKVEVVRRDGRTAFSKKMNEFCVVESKLGDGNLDFRLGLILEAEIWHLRQSVLNALCEPLAEVDNHGRCDIFFVAMFLDELSVKFFRNVKLNRVVASGDRLDIPLDKIVFGNLSNVVDVDEREQRDRNEDAANHKAFDLSGCKFFWGEHAASGHKDHGSFSEARIGHAKRREVGGNQSFCIGVELKTARGLAITGT